MPLPITFPAVADIHRPLPIAFPAVADTHRPLPIALLGGGGELKNSFWTQTLKQVDIETHRRAALKFLYFVFRGLQSIMFLDLLHVRMYIKNFFTC